jgi:predicted XRE-type DNA-binding protein
MMLVMISEMEAAQQRHQPAELVRPRIVVIGERLFIMAMRKVGAEVEKLKRGQDCGHRPEQQKVRIARSKPQIDSDDHAQQEQLSQPEIASEKLHIPRPEPGRMIAAEIRVAVRSWMLVMRHVLGQKCIEPEAGIEKQSRAPEGTVQPWPPRRQRAMHRIVRNDE